MVAAPIFGYLGDRFNRKVILSCGIFFWSIVTLSSSFIGKEVGEQQPAGPREGDMSEVKAGETRRTPPRLGGLALSVWLQPTESLSFRPVSITIGWQMRLCSFTSLLMVTSGFDCRQSPLHVNNAIIIMLGRGVPARTNSFRVSLLCVGVEADLITSS